MALSKSNWQITLGPDSVDPVPLVLLAFGGGYEAEFAFPWRQQRQRGGLARATLGINFARGSVENGLSFTTIHSFASDAEARQWCLDLNITANAWANVTTELKLEIEGVAGHYLLASASLDDLDPRVRIAGTAKATVPWQIGGCGWSFVPPP